MKTVMVLTNVTGNEELDVRGRRNIAVMRHTRGTSLFPRACVSTAFSRMSLPEW